jgi:hypothetical protein
VIREIPWDLRLEEENPGVLAEWVKTTIFPGASLLLDRNLPQPVPGEFQVHFTVLFDPGTHSGHAVLKFMFDTPPV